MKNYALTWLTKMNHEVLGQCKPLELLKNSILDPALYFSVENEFLCTYCIELFTFHEKCGPVYYLDTSRDLYCVG